MNKLEKFDPPIPQTNPAALVEQLGAQFEAAITRVLQSGAYLEKR